jgi:hypothetical protein
MSSSPWTLEMHFRGLLTFAPNDDGPMRVLLVQTNTHHHPDPHPHRARLRFRDEDLDMTEEEKEAAGLELKGNGTRVFKLDGFDVSVDDAPGAKPVPVKKGNGRKTVPRMLEDETDFAWVPDLTKLYEEAFGKTVKVKPEFLGPDLDREIGSQLRARVSLASGTIGTKAFSEVDAGQDSEDLLLLWHFAPDNDLENPVDEDQARGVKIIHTYPVSTDTVTLRARRIDGSEADKEIRVKAGASGVVRVNVLYVSDALPEPSGNVMVDPHFELMYALYDLPTGVRKLIPVTHSLPALDFFGKVAKAHADEGESAPHANDETRLFATKYNCIPGR